MIREIFMWKYVLGIIANNYGYIYAPFPLRIHFP